MEELPRLPMATALISKAATEWAAVCSSLLELCVTERDGLIMSPGVRPPAMSGTNLSRPNIQISLFGMLDFAAVRVTQSFYGRRPRLFRV